MKHTNADAMSRRPGRNHGDCPTCSQLHIMTLALQFDDSVSWKERQAEDPDLSPIYQRLAESKERPSLDEVAGCSWETRCLRTLWPHLFIADWIMYFQYGPTYTRRIILPQSMVKYILDKLHSELGHAGQRKMLTAVRDRFWWPSQQRDVINYCQACPLCMQFKGPTRLNKAPLMPMPSGFPNERLGVDIIGPLPETTRGNRYILVMVDYFTK